jgi:hypothetical protein
MTKIYKHQLPNSLYKEIVSHPTPSTINPITFWIDVKPSYFEIKATYLKEVLAETGASKETKEYTSEIYFWHKINLTDFLSKTSMSDNSLWSVSKDSIVAGHMYTEEIGPLVLFRAQIKDLFSITYNNKANFYNNASEGNDLYQIFVPAISDADMTKFTYRLICDSAKYDEKDLPVVIDPTCPAAEMIQENAITIQGLITPITATGPSSISPDSVFSVDVSTDSSISAIYVEQVHGVLPRLKIPLTNGAGTFKVSTIGMESGDNVEVKIGFKKYTNVVTYTKTVS